MISRILIKRYCHSHGRSKCYENIHKLDSLRQELNEIKEIVRYYEQPIRVIYFTSLVSLTGILGLTFSKK